MSKGMNEATFWEYLHSKHKGKIHRLDRTHTPDGMYLRVLVEFHIDEEDADELEMYRRIATVIDVIAEGE